MGYKGVYDKTIFHNPADGFSIISIRTADTSIPQEARSTYRHRDHLIRFTAVGYGLPLSDKVQLVLDGEWEHSKHGMQLRVEFWEESVPCTKEGVQAYLASGLFKGIGEKTAADIVARFGAGALDVIEETPEKLLEVRGITAANLEEIKVAYFQNRAIQSLMTYLAPFKVTPKTALKIHQFFGSESVSIIRNSPFELCRISGFGFKRVDDIARKTGCRPNDPMRIRGALFYVLDQSSEDDGNLYLTKDELCEAALALLNEKLPLPQLRLKMEEVADELYNVAVKQELVVDQGAIYLPRNYQAEDDVAGRVARMLASGGQSTDVSLALAKAKAALGIAPSKKQEEAVLAAFRHDLSIITGSPGTGKTTVLKLVIAVFQMLHPWSKIVQAAPTGRASRRMAESTGHPVAKTLHSLLGLGGDSGKEPSWRRHKMLDANLLIIDEFSMVDMWLASALFKRIRPGTKVVMVGDADQLPSVGAGNVFREFIACGLIPLTRLNEIFRQSADSRIPLNAKFINEGNTKLFYGDDFCLHECGTQQEAADFIRDIYVKEIAAYGIENVQILSPFKDRGETSATQLNLSIRERVNPASPERAELTVGEKVFRENDRVIQTQNNYDIRYTDSNGESGAGVYNGDIGVVEHIDAEAGKMTVLCEGRQYSYSAAQAKKLELSHSITIHRAQGSEFSVVIIPVLKAHYLMLYRNLIYTAITRGKSRVYLVGQKSYLYISIHTNKIDKRNTCLAQRIIVHYQELVDGAGTAAQPFEAQELPPTG